MWANFFGLPSMVEPKFQASFWSDFMEPTLRDSCLQLFQNLVEDCKQINPYICFCLVGISDQLIASLN
jgi:hypothetical protein